MNRKILYLLLILILGTANVCIFAAVRELEAIQKNDNILILAPHPDDETIGCAGVIQEALRVGAGVRVLYLTNGDNNQFAFIVYEKRLTFKKGEFIHMGEMRRKEAIKAMKLLGLNEKDLIFLGYPDFGTFTIFCKYWQAAKPYTSMLTRVSAVPYKENFSYGAPYIAESILADLKKVLLKYRPNKIFVSHSSDVNVDHKSLYLFLQVALSDLAKQIPYPKIYPYLIHYPGWPLPRHYHPELDLEPPPNFLDSEINWREFRLSPQQLDKKYRTILVYKSQTESSAFYLFSFARKNELFGYYPDIRPQRQIPLEPLKEEMKVSYGLTDDCLLVRIDKSKKLRRGFRIALYLFGYSYQAPFAQMPKVRIITKGNRFKIFDKGRLIEAGAATLERTANSMLLKIPLKILGGPDFVFAAIKSYRETLPVDVVGFRRLNIK